MKEWKFQSMTAVFMVLSIAGACMNAFQMKEGFYVWLAANCGWAWVDIYKKIWFGTVLHIIFAIACVVGLVCWG